MRRTDVRRPDAPDGANGISRSYEGIALASRHHVPSVEHEMPLELIRNRPDIVRDLLRSAGSELPDGTLELISGDFTELTSGPHFADGAIAVRSGGDTTLGVVVEVQRDRDEDKVYAGRPT